MLVCEGQKDGSSSLCASGIGDSGVGMYTKLFEAHPEAILLPGRVVLFGESQGGGRMNHNIMAKMRHPIFILDS